MSYNNSILIIGTHTLEFESFTEFRQWKEHEEENTYTTYTRVGGAYHPRPPTEGMQFQIVY